MKRVWLVLVACLVAAALFEGLSFGYWFFKRDEPRFAGPRAFIADDASIRRDRNVFDPKLGWKKRFDTEFGERPRNLIRDRALVATFGDSFVYGDEVGDFDAWQRSLGDLLGGDVFNFGVGGYGPDQALLRFEDDFPKVNADVAVLGVITENIGRIVNVYRRFYVPAEGLALTKPRFVLVNGTLALKPNPLASAADMEKLKDPEFIRKIGQDDYWFQNSFAAAPGFPFSRVFFTGGSTGTLINMLFGREIWTRPEPRALFFALIDAFAAKSLEFGAFPVIVLHPIKLDAQELGATGRHSAPAAALLDHCRAKGIAVFDGISALVGHTRSSGEIEQLFGKEHLSAGANAALAHDFADFLAKTVPPGRSAFAQSPLDSAHRRALALAPDAGRKPAAPNPDAFLAKLYRGLFHRDPDPDGLDHYRTLLLTKQRSGGEIAVELAFSPESPLTRLPDRDFPAALYTALTPPDLPSNQSPIDRAAKLLKRGTSRKSLAYESVQSAAFRQTMLADGVSP